MQSRSVEFAKKFGVVFEVRSSASTTIPEPSSKRRPRIWKMSSSAASAIEKNQAKVTIRQVPDRPGTAARIFSALAAADLSVDMIVQSGSVGDTNDISFTAQQGRTGQGQARPGGARSRKSARRKWKPQEGIAKLSIVGIGMRSHSGVAARLFEALSAGGINIQMISTSEIKTAVIIEESKINEAAALAHEAFGLGVKA